MTSPPLFATDEQRWEAVTANNADADGCFFYGVQTTGVFCRPSCTSRRPNRKNVEYFRTCEEAEKSGYRPCKKCSPKTFFSKTEKKIIRACRRMEKSETPIPLKTLAEEAHLSPHYFQRTFKRVVGITPKQYAAALRSRRFRNELESGSSVTEAIYAAGFGSSSGIYGKKRCQLAMEPKIYKKGAPGETITYGLAQCYLGVTLVAATQKGICTIMFGDNRETLVKKLRSRFPKADFMQAGPGFTSLLDEVMQFIEEPKSECSIPLDIQGTSFQQRVWDVLRRIEPGETLSYSDVAEQIGNPKSVRAVASACGANKIAVLIPCHRVIAKDGKLGGYHWGPGRKKMLLESEKK